MNFASISFLLALFSLLISSCAFETRQSKVIFILMRDVNNKGEKKNAHAMFTLSLLCFFFVFIRLQLSEEANCVYHISHKLQCCRVQRRKNWYSGDTEMYWLFHCDTMERCSQTIEFFCFIESNMPAFLAFLTVYRRLNCVRKIYA